MRWRTKHKKEYPNRRSLSRPSGPQIFSPASGQIHPQTLAASLNLWAEAQKINGLPSEAAEEAGRPKKEVLPNEKDSTL